MQGVTSGIEVFEVLEGMDLFDLFFDSDRREHLKLLLSQMSEPEFEEFCRIYRDISCRRDATATMQ